MKSWNPFPAILVLGGLLTPFPSEGLSPQTAFTGEKNAGVFVFNSPAEIVGDCARKISEVIKQNNKLGRPTRICLGAGLSVSFVCEKLIQMLNEEKKEPDGLDFSNTIVWGLDEYDGLPPNHLLSRQRHFCEYFLHPKAVHSQNNPRGFKKENIHLLSKGDIETSQKIENFDLQVLELDYKGFFSLKREIKFSFRNVDGGSVDKPELEGWDKYFRRFIIKTPRAFTHFDLGVLCRSKRIFILAAGAEKAAVVNQTLSSPLRGGFPASVFLLHPRAEFILDSGAASQWKVHPCLDQSREPDPLLMSWLEMWKNFYRIPGKLKVLLTYAHNEEREILWVFLQEEDSLKLVAQIVYKAMRKRVFVFWQQTAEEFKRKKVMALLYLFLIHDFQVESIGSTPLSDEGIQFFKGLKKSDVFLDFYGDNDGNSATVNFLQAQKLASDPSVLFWSPSHPDMDTSI